MYKKDMFCSHLEDNRCNTECSSLLAEKNKNKSIASATAQSFWKSQQDKSCPEYCHFSRQL